MCSESFVFNTPRIIKKNIYKFIRNKQHDVVRIKENVFERREKFPAKFPMLDFVNLCTCFCG